MKKVLVLDTLELRHVRRSRGASGACVETFHEIGFAGEDEIRYNKNTSKMYVGFHHAEENWRRIEYLLVGDGNWHIPPAPHPDCLVVREPRDGEIFDSETDLLWLAPGRCGELTGTLAARLFEGKHGDVVGDLGEYLEQQVFDECLGRLTAEYGLDVEGPHWRYLVQALATAVGEATLVGADEDVIDEIAAQVHDSVMRFLE